jgi:hypothetical protein
MQSPKALKLPKTILTADGCRPAASCGFGRPMYRSAAETVALLAMAIKEKTGGEVRWARAVESGIVEEYALVAEDSRGQHLICRIWPVFFAFERRIEYKLYEAGPEISALVETYLGLCARANDARLLGKP